MQLHHASPLTKGLVCFGVFGLSALPGCATDERPVITVNEGPSVPVPTGDEACAGKDDGEACGDERHCVTERCVRNTCGDGIQAAGEACDDGNAVAGDGCSPACNVEYTLCGTGEYVIAGSDCPVEGAAEPEPEPEPEDAGSGGKCPALIGGSAEGHESSEATSTTSARVTAKQGQPLKLHMDFPRGKRGEDGWFVWRVTRDKLGKDPSTNEVLPRTFIYDDDLLASKSAASNSFTCRAALDRETWYVLATMLVRSCPAASFEFEVVCLEPSLQAPDASTTASPSRDAGT
jgi:cysteine-rich repeat protein